MKNKELWKESKYICKKGHWLGSRDPKELGISSRLIADLTVRCYEKYVPLHASGHLLDLGCGKAPLYGLYSEYVTEVCCADWENSFHSDSFLDVLCNLNGLLPWQDESFDTIILSDVLEHIAEPKQLIAEMYRILRPNGKILMNVPFFYWIHEAPYDYCRYTKYALHKFAVDEKFKVSELFAIGGFSTVFADITSKTIIRLPLVGKYVAELIQFIVLKNITSPKKEAKKYKDTAFPLGYFMILEKE